MKNMLDQSKLYTDVFTYCPRSKICHIITCFFLNIETDKEKHIIKITSIDIFNNEK